MTEESRHLTNEKQLKNVHPTLARKVRAVLTDLEGHGWQPYIASAWRSVAEQKKIVERGDSKVYFSFHNATRVDGTPCALACDIVDVRYSWDSPKRYWTHLGSSANAHELVWGGGWKNFPDVAHVQLLSNSLLTKVKNGWLP